MNKGNAARFVQRVVNGACEAAQIVRPGSWGAEKANAKGHVRLELGAALRFVKARPWVPLLQEEGRKIGGHQVGVVEWMVVRHDWWEAFAEGCKAAW